LVLECEYRAAEALDSEVGGGEAVSGFGGGFALVEWDGGRGLVLAGGREVDGGGDGGVGERSSRCEEDVWIGVSGLKGLRCGG
jgi:hypothetical protein